MGSIRQASELSKKLSEYEKRSQPLFRTVSLAIESSIALGTTSYATPIRTLYDLAVFIKGEYDMRRDRDSDRMFEKHLELITTEFSNIVDTVKSISDEVDRCQEALWDYTSQVKGDLRESRSLISRLKHEEETAQKSVEEISKQLQAITEKYQDAQRALEQDEENLRQAREARDYALRAPEWWQGFDNSDTYGWGRTISQMSLLNEVKAKTAKVKILRDFRDSQIKLRVKENERYEISKKARDKLVSTETKFQELIDKIEPIQRQCIQEKENITQKIKPPLLVIQIKVGLLNSRAESLEFALSKEAIGETIIDILLDIPCHTDPSGLTASVFTKTLHELQSGDDSTGSIKAAHEKRYQKLIEKAVDV